MDNAVFLLEKLKLQAQRELEDRVGTHLKKVFYNKILPGVIDDIKTNLVIDLINDDDRLELTIKIKETE